MSVTPIESPFQGERVLGLSPTPEARVADWNRRLNLFTGRALSASALIAEQSARNGRLALRGQMVSPGVVAGLEAGIEPRDATRAIQIGGGFGVCASGEDLCVIPPPRLAAPALP